MYNRYNSERGFLFPFLIGGLTGGAVASLAGRPQVTYYQPIGQPSFNPAFPAGGYSYFNYYPISYPGNIYYGRWLNERFTQSFCISDK